MWHKLEVSGRPVGVREGHTLTYSSGLDCYLLFGGIGTQRYKEVQAFSIASQSWETIATVGKSPVERNGHVAWIDDENQILYVHGGQSAKREALGDLYALHLDDNSWSRVALAEDQPEERSLHAAAKVQDRAFIFGGFSPSNGYLKDLWSFNFGAVDWASGRVNGAGWTRHMLRGQVPAGRKAHTMVSFEGKLYLFGGVTEQGYSNDLFCINTADFKCTKIASKGAVPSPRAFHTATVMDHNGIMTLFGGQESVWDGKTEKVNILGDFYLLNLHDLRWTQQPVPAGASFPTRRYGHAMEYGYSETGQIVLIGGIERNHCQMDVFLLEEGKSTAQWSPQQEIEGRERAGQVDNSAALRAKVQELERQLQTSQQRM